MPGQREQAIRERAYAIWEGKDRPNGKDLDHWLHAEGEIMRCIFCLKEKVESDEHVFPFAIGGCLITKRVCASCNSKLGTSIDAPLINHTAILLRRAELGIAGKSGDVPDAFSHLFGDAVLASDKSQRLKITVDPSTNKLDIYKLYWSPPLEHQNDGRIIKRITVDVRDVGTIDKSIQRERKRLGLEPFPQEYIDKIMADALKNITTTENPEVISTIEQDTQHLFERGLVKIVYELAFFWFGEDYLDDPVAIHTRTYINNLMTLKAGAASVPMKGIITSNILQPMELWSGNRNIHIAYAMVKENSAAICLKIFDLFYAVLLVSENANRYLAGHLSDEKLRFLVIDPITRTMMETTFMEEIRRIVSNMRGREVDRTAR